MRTTAYAWRCEYPNCGRIWLAKTEDAPRLCAGCKKTGWHKTITLQETIRLSNWREQMMEEAKPYISEQIKAGIAQAILDAKKRKGEYVAEVAPTMPNPSSIQNGARCAHSQPDYEIQVTAHCGKMAGHKYTHGAWIMGEPLDP